MVTREMRSAIANEALRSSLADRAGFPATLMPGYAGLLLFMTGDGIESGFLAPFLAHQGLAESDIGRLFTLYGIAAAIAAWMSGALTDAWGPRRVMWNGLLIWVCFHTGFLVFGPSSRNLTLLFYGLRGFGYPLFAFAFLVWITRVTPERRLGTAVGWYWFAFTGGLPALGSLLASVAIPRIGAYATLWCSLVLVVCGGVVALTGMPGDGGPSGRPGGERRGLQDAFTTISLVWREPKIALGLVVAVINTTPRFGFLVFLPSFYTATAGFPMTEWLRLLSGIFTSNILCNLVFGIVGDRLGWRHTIAVFGGVGSAITTLLLFYVPGTFGANFPLAMLAGVCYGATLAGFVPLSALMASVVPDNKGAAVSMLTLGSSTGVWVGPAIAWLFLPAMGVQGVMWIFALLYLLSAGLVLLLKLPSE